MPILPALEFPSVRAALDVSIKPEMIPDVVIAQPIFLGRAEREIASRVENIEGFEGEDRRRLLNAVIYLTAAYIAPSVPNITGMSMLGNSVQKSAIDWVARAAQLQVLANAELETLTVIDETPSRRFLPVMGRARGYR